MDDLDMSSTGTRQRLVVGAMTGTSMDGIDVARVQIDGCGLGVEVHLNRHVSVGLGSLSADLRRAAEQEPMSAEEFSRLALGLGELHAKAIDELIEPGEIIDLITVHGQTIVHQPPVSWQLIDPAPIAKRFGCPVICELRQADLAAGGQGAPITPLADWILYRHAEHRRVIVNLGGFCNITVLPTAASIDPLEHIEGFDVCACNHVLDGVARKVLDQPFDKDGCGASAGKPNAELSSQLQGLLADQSADGRSLGTGDELSDWIETQSASLSPNDLLATVVEAMAGTIAGRVNTFNPDEVVLAGGGVMNRTLVARISFMCNAPVNMSDDLGIPPTAREALAMAVLGVLCADGIPITLPQITGCSIPAPLAGRWCTPPGTAAPVVGTSGQNR